MIFQIFNNLIIPWYRLITWQWWIGENKLKFVWKDVSRLTESNDKKLINSIFTVQTSQQNFDKYSLTKLKFTNF
jgi:hypothetical protein